MNAVLNCAMLSLNLQTHLIAIVITIDRPVGDAQGFTFRHLYSRHPSLWLVSICIQP